MAMIVARQPPNPVRALFNILLKHYRRSVTLSLSNLTMPFDAQWPLFMYTILHNNSVLFVL